MGRTYGRVHRLLRLVTFLQQRPGRTIDELSRELAVVERQVYRDVATLNESGVPVLHDPNVGGYRVRPGFFMPPVELRVEEAMAMAALLDQLPRDDQLPFFEPASRAIEKIRSQLPEAMLSEIEPLDDRVHIDLARGMADDSPRDVYECARAAIRDRRQLRCRYEPLGGGDETTFLLKPFLLWYCQRAWYVVGQRDDRNEPRVLKLNRFSACAKTDLPFAIPDDFSLRGLLGNAWRMMRGDRAHHVVVRFEPGFSETASETRWHPTQRETWTDDGRRVTLEFDVDGLDEIVWWILGYGPGATVLEPAELVDRVSELVQATARRYAGP